MSKKLPIKECLIFRAMLPLRFPDAFDQLVNRLQKCAKEDMEPFKQRCRCSPRCGFTNEDFAIKHNFGFIIPRPDRDQVAAFTEKMFEIRDTVFQQKFMQLFNVPHTIK